MKPKPIYFERVSSLRTEALFIALTLLFLILLARRLKARTIDRWSILFLCACSFFLFYSLNYRVLTIRITERDLHLKFGLFGWTIPLENVAACYLDGTSLWRIGGAGIHFSLFAGRYRAMFNFLEHPRLLIALAQKQGPVRDIAFSTCHPEELMGLIKLPMEQEGAA